MRGGTRLVRKRTRAFADVFSLLSFARDLVNSRQF
jgi:hypothetical protein